MANIAKAVATGSSLGDVVRVVEVTRYLGWWHIEDAHLYLYYVFSILCEYEFKSCGCRFEK